MYFNRALSNDFAGFLEKGRELSWLFDYVVQHEDLDLQIAKSKSKQWIAVYYGNKRIFSVKRLKEAAIFVDTPEEFHKISGGLYGRRNIDDLFSDEIKSYIQQVKLICRPDWDAGNGKPGYPLNRFSRRYGICGKPEDDFAVADREPAVGFRDQLEQEAVVGSIRRRYRQMSHALSVKFPDLCTGDPDEDSIVIEPDFLALDKEGNILLIVFIESDTKGLTCNELLRLGYQHDLISALRKNELEYGVLEMASQRQRIGLINSMWKCPAVIREIIPVLAIPVNPEKAGMESSLNSMLDFIRKEYHDSFLENLSLMAY